MGSEKNLSESLRYIYEHKGIDTFLNEKIMYSILSDLMPRNTKEINWVIDAINSGAVKPLIEAEKNNFNKEEYKQKARRVFEGNEISESRINYLLNSFFYGLKWTDKIISFEEIKQKEKISQNKNINSNNNTKKHNEQTKNAKKNNQKNNDKKEVYDKNKHSDNHRKNTNQQRLNKSQVDKLEFEYNKLFNTIDNDIQHNEDYIINSKGHNIFFNGFLNIVVFLACLSVMFSYLFILKEGYVFKRILFLDIIGLVLGIKILMNNFKNLKKLKEDMQLKNINKEYISLINQIGSNKIQLKKGAVRSFNKYNELNNLLRNYKEEYRSISNKWSNCLNSRNSKNEKIAKTLIVFCIIFIVSGVYEPRLVYDKDNIITMISRNVVEGISSSVYESERGCVKANLANVRRTANKESKSVGKVEKYDVVYLTGKSYERDGKTWYELEMIDGKGWISGSVITVVPKIVRVTEEAANIREKANINSDIADVVKRDETLYTTGKAVVAKKRTWYEVYLNGEDGYWISSNVVEEK